MSRTTFFGAALPIIAVAALLSACVSSEPARKPAPRVPDTPSDPGAVTPPPHLLKDDTIAALEHDWQTDGNPFIGAWASDINGCNMMDQTQFEGFAVISPDTVRQPGGTCSYTVASAQGGSFSLAAQCKKGGDRTIRIAMINGKSMSIQNDRNQPGTTLIRCHLQK